MYLYIELVNDIHYRPHYVFRLFVMMLTNWENLFVVEAAGLKVWSFVVLQFLFILRGNLIYSIQNLSSTVIVQLVFIIISSKLSYKADNT